ncbi:MAG: hypothetical protein AAF456_00730 [Planctomycetota bacterium]
MSYAEAVTGRNMVEYILVDSDLRQVFTQKRDDVVVLLKPRNRNDVYLETEFSDCVDRDRYLPS